MPPRLVKYCRKEHNPALGATTLQLGTFEYYRSMDPCFAIADPGEATHRVNFREGVSLSICRVHVGCVLTSTQRSRAPGSYAQSRGRLRRFTRIPGSRPGRRFERPRVQGRAGTSHISQGDARQISSRAPIRFSHHTSQAWRSFGCGSADPHSPMPPTRPGVECHTVMAPNRVARSF